MLNRYFYLLIIFLYLSGCEGCGESPTDGPYVPYLLDAYNKAQLNQAIERFSSEASTPELSNEWKEALGRMNGPGTQPREEDLTLEDNIKQLTIENRDTLWRVVSSISPAQQTIFLKELNSFNKDQQATLLDTILHLAHRNEQLIKEVLNGKFSSLPILEQLNLGNIVQGLKANDQTLLFQFIGKLGYNT